MGAYKSLRHEHCCVENEFLLNQVLKNDWGFKGMVISDWGGAHDSRGCAMNGLDLENGMARNRVYFFGESRTFDMVKKGELPMAGLDEKVRRNLRVMFETHVFETNRVKGSINTAAHETRWRAMSPRKESSC